MVLRILVMSSLADLIPAIAVCIASIWLLPVSATVRVWVVVWLACWELDALLFVMLAISSSVADVSSSEAACALAPSASDWLAWEICSASCWFCAAAACSTSLSSYRLRRIERLK
jgi:hypothetical protein